MSPRWVSAVMQPSPALLGTSRRTRCQLGCKAEKEGTHPRRGPELARGKSGKEFEHGSCGHSYSVDRRLAGAVVLGQRAWPPVLLGLGSDKQEAEARQGITGMVLSAATQRAEAQPGVLEASTNLWCLVC